MIKAPVSSYRRIFAAHIGMLGKFREIIIDFWKYICEDSTC